MAKFCGNCGAELTDDAKVYCRQYCFGFYWKQRIASEGYEFL